MPTFGEASVGLEMDLAKSQVASGRGVTGPEKKHTIEFIGRVRVVEASVLPWLSAEKKACLGLA